MSAAFLPKASKPLFLEPVALNPDQRALAWMAASLLLDYPSIQRQSQFERIRAAVEQLPDPVRSDFVGFLDAADELGEQELEAHFTAIFDQKRKCCPYLSYYSNGDTRNRGMALVRFVEAYRDAGWEPDQNELPDYLPMVLEFAAKSSSPIGSELLASHQDGIEVLRTALESFDSPYAKVVAAVCRSLPEIDDETKERYLSLVNEGPPTELVGLSYIGHLAPYSPTGAPNEGVRV